ncbi:MAG: GNAT family N-acetyltransferase [Spirochaetota bacterium]|nr:GNAT family N-acetyltransferase [Spirochaetota bacterium]
MVIRVIKYKDAENFLKLKYQLDNESKFLLLEPGERKTTLNEQIENIKNILSMDNSVIFVVENNNKLIGYLSAIGGKYKRNEHVVNVVIAILNEFTGQGIGKMLFAELEKWAVYHNIHRLELTTMTHNFNALTLYKKMGFQIEGERIESLYIDGKYINEYYLYKLII